MIDGNVTHPRDDQGGATNNAKKTGHVSAEMMDKPTNDGMDNTRTDEKHNGKDNQINAIIDNQSNDGTDIVTHNGKENTTNDGKDKPTTEKMGDPTPDKTDNPTPDGKDNSTDGKDKPTTDRMGNTTDETDIAATDGKENPSNDGMNNQSKDVKNNTTTSRKEKIIYGGKDNTTNDGTDDKTTLGKDNAEDNATIDGADITTTVGEGVTNPDGLDNQTSVGIVKNGIDNSIITAIDNVGLNIDGTDITTTDVIDHKANDKTDITTNGGMEISTNDRKDNQINNGTDITSTDAIDHTAKDGMDTKTADEKDDPIHEGMDITSDRIDNPAHGGMSLPELAIAESDVASHGKKKHNVLSRAYKHVKKGFGKTGSYDLTDQHKDGEVKSTRNHEATQQELDHSLDYQALIEQTLKERESMANTLNNTTASLIARDEEVKQQVSEIKQKEAFIEQTLEKLKRMTDDLDNTTASLRARDEVVKQQVSEIKQKEVFIEQTLEEKKSMTDALNNNTASLKARDEEVKQQVSEIQQKTADIARLQAETVACYTQIESLQEEKSELILRLSKLASAKLTQNNPNIADLSDTNRPTVLAERFSELYDNEYTDAFEELGAVMHLEDNTNAQLMLALLQATNDECVKLSKRHEESLKNFVTFVTLSVDQYPILEEMSVLSDTVEDPNTFGTSIQKDAEKVDIKVELTVDQTKSLSDIRKTCASRFEQEKSISKLIASKVAHQNKIDPKSQTKTMAYITKCAHVCWYMAIQEPRVVIEFHEVMDGEPFNKDLYKQYTKGGTMFDFIVWPPMFLYKEGPMLCKGVAQGKN